MITDTYTRSKPINQIVAEGYNEVIPTLLAEQSKIANRYYLRRTSPHLADVLVGSGMYEVKSDSDSVQAKINYPATIRFVDLKRTRKGKKSATTHLSITVRCSAISMVEDIPFQPLSIWQFEMSLIGISKFFVSWTIQS